MVNLQNGRTKPNPMDSEDSADLRSAREDARSIIRQRITDKTTELLCENAELRKRENVKDKRVKEERVKERGTADDNETFITISFVLASAMFILYCFFW